MICLPAAKFMYRPQSVAAWSPLSLPLYGWYKSDAGISVSTDGDPIATWSDQSGNARDLTQSTAAQRPTFRTSANGVNGKPVVEFAAATTDVQQLINTTFDGNASTGFSFYVVYQATSLAVVNGGRFGLGSPSQALGSLYYRAGAFGVPNSMQVFISGTSEWTLGAYGTQYQVAKLARATTAAVSKFKATYGAEGLTSVPNNNLPAGFFLGGLNIGSAGTKIAEVIVCNKELTPTEEASLDAYFRSRYGFGLYYGADLPVASPALWLDASRSDSLYVESTLATAVTTDNGPVGGWKDLSGNNRHALQGTTGSRPTWRTPINGQNGLGVLSFNGSSQWIVSPLSTSTPYTQFVVVKVKDNVRINRVLHGGTSTQDVRYLFGSSGGNYAIYLSSNNSAWTGGALPLLPTTSIYNSWKNLSVTNTGTSTGFLPHVNNTALNAGNGTLAPFSNMTLGYGPSSQYANMDLAEVIQYDFVLNATQLASVNAYLSAKWGT